MERRKRRLQMVMPPKKKKAEPRRKEPEVEEQGVGKLREKEFDVIGMETMFQLLRYSGFSMKS
jgi:hypothetical protein